MPQYNDLPFALVLLVVFASLGVGLLLLTRQHRASLPLQFKLFLTALGVRFLASLAIYEFGLVKVLGDEDASGWSSGVVQMQQWMQRQIGWLDLPEAMAQAFYQQQQGYRYLLGAFFYVTDAPARMPAATLNCFFGALTVVIVFRIAEGLFSQWVAVRVGWATCLFPSLVIWSAQTVKEPVVILLEVVALYACVQLKREGFSLRYTCLCGLAILLLLPFRFYAAYLAAAAALLGLLIPQIGKRNSSMLAGVGIALLVIPLAISSGILARSEALFERFDLKFVSEYQRGVSIGQKSGVTLGYDLQTPSGLALGILVGGAHLLLAPFPWQLGGASLRMVLVLPELLVWWWLFFFGVLPGAWLAVRRRFGELQALFIFSGGLGLLYSLLFGNIGLAVRQRAQLLPLLLIFAMVGLEQRRLKAKQRQAAHPEILVSA